MIDRTFMPPAAPMTEWPDWDTASPRVLCAPLSATVQSPRGDLHAGSGYALSPKALLAKVAAVRRLNESRSRKGEPA